LTPEVQNGFSNFDIFSIMLILSRLKIILQTYPFIFMHIIMQIKNYISAKICFARYNAINMKI
jgi:hypothetical protein